MNTIQVDLAERSYPIYIGNGLLENEELINRHIAGKHVMIVTNDKIAKLFLPRLQKSIQKDQVDVVVLPDGEEYKNISTLNLIFDALLDKKHNRDTTLIALGGGVVCDMTGFAAACYQRGVAFIQMPTSLLAQVDASIGGKTAVNHPQGKNMIGAFHQPQCVIIDTNTLDTLPDREVSAGIAEIIKAALIQSADFFCWLEKNMPRLLEKNKQALAYAIEQSCMIKANIVSGDERETTGLRALLNLGHTFGHAIERLLNYKTLLHGETVAIGMVLAAELSKQLGWISAQDVVRITTIISSANLPTRLPAALQCDKMLSVMAVDKKVKDSQLRLVLLRGIGIAELTNQISVGQIKQVLSENR